MKSINKTQISDFKLLSPMTKKRIAGLIEMKLTPQTIALFAQEYEDYDTEVRLEIVEFIGFLMEDELSKFMSQVQTQTSDENIIKRRRMEFEEKSKNIRKIQDILVEPKSAFRNKKDNKVSKDNGEMKIVQPSLVAKVSKEKTDNKIDRLMREAQERERKSIKEKREEDLKKEKELENSKKISSIKKDVIKKEEKPEKEIVKKVDDIEQREKAARAEFLKRQKDVQQEKERQAREYARREAEKEKLWIELYGKSRLETQKQRDAAEQQRQQKPEAERDKTPHIKDLKITSYDLFGNKYPIEELIDPKNKVYLFWFKIKQKFSIGNMFSFIESLELSRQKKFFKKRAKWLRKVSKNSEQATLTVQKEAKISNDQQQKTKVDNKNNKENKNNSEEEIKK